MENREENSQKSKKRKHNEKPNEEGNFETSLIETKMENLEENSHKGKKRKPKKVAMENQQENSQKRKKRKHNEKPNEVANFETSIIETKMENQEENSQKSKKRKHNEEPNEVANIETSTIETKMENHEENSQKSKKRKPKEVAVFGNYRNYYGYRLAGDIEQDPRFKVFKKEWFEGKDCLDIGCNQGLITIEIARKFCCRSIVGVDIDNSLVESSYWNLKRISKMEDVSCRSSNGSVSDHSEKTIDLEANKTAMSTDAEIDKSLFERVSFRKENFVKNLYPYKEKYDAILCLSVTKWVHLNWGDDGLITLFANMWRLLRPGGILILEPQPWKSYQKNYLVSERTQSNYYDITVYPCLFQEILLDKIGFRTVKNIAENVPGSAAGFNRPIFLFGK